MMLTQTEILDNCKHELNKMKVFRSNGSEQLVCCDCWNAGVDARKAARKAQLAEMPRCEVPGCKSRGTLTVARLTLMCGRHFHKAESEMVRRSGGMFFGAVYPSKQCLIEMAGGVK